MKEPRISVTLAEPFFGPLPIIIIIGPILCKYYEEGCIQYNMLHNQAIT